jgi:hypothetical protein
LRRPERRKILVNFLPRSKNLQAEHDFYIRRTVLWLVLGYGRDDKEASV